MMPESKLFNFLALEFSKEVRKMNDRQLADVLVNSDTYGESSGEAQALLSEVITRLLRVSGPPPPDWNERHRFIPAFHPADCAICGEDISHDLHGAV